MTCFTMTASTSKSLVHRDQHQIRKRLLNHLGITPSRTATGAPSISKGTVLSTPKLSCTQGNCSSPEWQQEASSCSSSGCSDSQEERHVRFAPDFATREIPSHREYDEETRQSIWMGTREIERNARRNRLEYLADGFNYQKATEEKGMMRINGELVHPATYWIRYEEEQHRLLQEELFGMPSTSSSTPSLGGMPIKKSPTMPSLTGMAA